MIKSLRKYDGREKYRLKTFLIQQKFATIKEKCSKFINKEIFLSLFGEKLTTIIIIIIIINVALKHNSFGPLKRQNMYLLNPNY